jgi:hypothetical protein
MGSIQVLLAVLRQMPAEFRMPIAFPLRHHGVFAVIPPPTIGTFRLRALNLSSLNQVAEPTGLNGVTQQ